VRGICRKLCGDYLEIVSGLCGCCEGMSRDCRWIDVTGYLVTVQDLSGSCQVMIWGLSRHRLGIVRGLSRDCPPIVWECSGDCLGIQSGNCAEMVW